MKSVVADMCTVAYIPKADHIILLSLRDENPIRPAALPPHRFSADGIEMMYPYDMEGGGTWIGVNQWGAMVVLLNGAFEKHERQTQYESSRGLIVKKMLGNKSPVSVWNEMDLNGKEAHTLVVSENSQLYQLVWDEQQKHNIVMDPTVPYVWSSATLYDRITGEARNQSLLQRIKSSRLVDRLSLLDFFREYGDNENGFIMNRNELVKTLSMSYLVHYDNSIEFNYHELNTDNLHVSEINIVNTGHE